MPAFNFKSQFASLVKSGEKTQTIHKDRKDGRAPAVVGDLIHLYIGQRTKECRKLAHGLCTGVYNVEMDYGLAGVPSIWIDGRLLFHANPETDNIAVLNDNQFAKADGFQNFMEMWIWFKDHHGLPFHGKLITWKYIALQKT